MFTKQETFNIVAKHLLKQNKKAYLKNESTCAYRGEDGLKCAAGCLIPDDQYSPLMERSSVYSSQLVQNCLKDHDLNLVVRLQGIHDAYNPEFWDVKLQALASELGLVYNLPELFKE